MELICPICKQYMKNPSRSTWAGIDVKTKTFSCSNCYTKVIVSTSYLKIKGIEV